MLNGVQPLLGLFGQGLNVGHHEVSIGLVVAASYPSPQLVELGQAKLISSGNHDGVGGGHVNASLNNGGTQQQVVALGHKVTHHGFQLAFGHLPMGNGDAGFGQKFFQLGAAVFNGFHLVVQKVHLTAAFELAQHGFANHALPLGAHKGFDGQAPLRGCGDHA